MKARFLIAVLLWLPIQTGVRAASLETILDTTLQKNPAIQQAKLNLEQAAGDRLVLRSVVWPGLRANIPAGIQGGHRGGSNSIKAFGFVRGAFTQPLFNAAIPASLRRGDIDLLIAEQQLNVAVVEQLHAARLAFYSALYNRQLLSLRQTQRQRLNENVSSEENRYRAGLTDRSAVTGATVQAHDLDSQIEGARRDYGAAQLKLAEAIGSDLGQSANHLPEPEGDLQFAPVAVDLNAETESALERRTDVKLARLLVRAANEDERIIAAGYYPVVNGTVTADYIPVTGIHREGSTSRTQDFIGSEIREGATLTWLIIDSGKTTGAVIKQRKAREVNEAECRKLEANVARELSRIRNELESIEGREKSLAAATNAAEQDVTTIKQNLGSGLSSELEYRLAENSYLQTKTGLVDAAYLYNVALAEWDRATGRYFQFSDDTPQNVH